MSGVGIKTKTSKGGGAPPLASAPEGPRRTPPNGGDPRNAPEESGLVEITMNPNKTKNYSSVGELSTQVRGVTYGKSAAQKNPKSGYLPVLRAGNISDEGLGFDDLVFVPSNRISEKQKIRKNDVLIAASSGSLDVVGKAAQALADFEGGFGAFCKVLRPNSKVHPGYFSHFFKTKDYRTRISALASGANINNLRNEHLDEMQIPLPPLPEQRRIAEVLDRAEGLRAKRRKSIVALDDLTQAMFLEMFGDPTSNPKGWPSDLTLSDVADIASGVTKGRNLFGKPTREIPYLAVANVQDKHLDLSAVKSILATAEEIQRFKILENDLLLTEGGDPDKLGRGSLWNNELPECIHQNHIFRVRIQTKTLNPLFLNWLVGSQRGKRYFLSQSKQTTGIASINMSRLRRFPMLMPPISLQQEFARRIAAVEKLKNAHRTSLAQLDALFASLQHRTFRGEL